MIAMAEWEVLPDSILCVEQFAVYCQGIGKGKCIDLGNRNLMAKGGYAREYGFVWHEHPQPHWHLPFLSDNTKIRNGELTLSPRTMLVNFGKGMGMSNVRIHGKCQYFILTDVSARSSGQSYKILVIGSTFPKNI